MKCRICKDESFGPVVDLGFTPFADDFRTSEQLKDPETYYPLKVVICLGCSLVQLTCTAPRELLYQGDYPYVSSTTDMGVRHYHDMANRICDRFGLCQGHLSVDIGSNIGVLAEGFKNRHLNAIGVEPAPKIAKMANERGIQTVNEFFSLKIANKISEDYGPASVVTGTNVVAHIDDLHELAEGLDALLAENGIFVFEAPYLGNLLEQCAYDTIYHEHLSYLAIRPIDELFRRHGMEVFDVEPMRIHGGTLRYYISRSDQFGVNSRVKNMIVEEYRFSERKTLDNFALRVSKHRDDLNWLLRKLKRDGAKIAAVSAPAKGMTLLNFCGIGKDVLSFVTEKAPLKIGRYTPGTHIPVISDEMLQYEKPDYALLLAWNFADEIMANLSNFEGKFIIPIPEPVIIDRKIPT